MAKFVHAMIRVLDESKSVSFYDQAFGLKVAERLDFDGFTLVYLSNAENTFELELTINKNQSAPYDLGNGYGHTAFVVDDVDAEHQRFEEAGLAPRKLVDFAHEGKTLARFFFVQDPDGYEIEVMQRLGRYQ
ncbi:lactoylglutathione lyase [Loktanella sp. D2R18]|uniref:VOC family protein n=1 Tax=Rhodobacterales TaxID=204455 RepID=UPI000DEADED2|nr:MULTISPECIES: VOC family protein [Rhodobacterales]MDO6590000.1 VOC family protein [Yoonia sp. 1_MG-2023]RBW45861.1 lactoylglutathione lyase [Loktanella sp. D2R18]